MAASSARVRLRVSPGADRSRVVGRHGDAWKVRVAAPATDGKANRALLSFLSRTLGLPGPSVELVTGGGSRDKVVLVHGVTRDEADARLASAAEGQ
jgi:uncharacterized protein (TIGR00251 family)